MNIFKLTPKLIFGTDSLKFIEEFKNDRVFIVADPFMVKSGKTDLICGMLSGEVMIFSDIVPDPPIENITAGVAKMTEFKPQTVIAIGGGSAIDAAKAIVNFSQKIIKSEKINFIAVPTTSGTGSEVTSFAVITNREKGIKYPLVSNELLPDTAILDPALVQSVPENIAADTGMDVLTHALEAYVSTKATDFSDAFAEKAVRMVFSYLKKSCEGDAYAREKMHNASCLAGLAFNEASLGLNHAIAHNVGGRLKLPHGRTNAVLLPHIIEFNAENEKAAAKYACLARLTGVEGSSERFLIKNFIKETIRLRSALKIPSSFTECGVSGEDLEKYRNDIAEGALADGCIKTNPRKVIKSDIIEILHKV